MSSTAAPAAHAAMPLRGRGLPIFLAGALACGAAWAVAAAGGEAPGLLLAGAGEGAESCRLRELRGEAEAEDHQEECMSQLQTAAAGWPRLRPRCAKLATEVTKSCKVSEVLDCIGEINPTDPVESTKFPDNCATEAGIEAPSAKVYKIRNDEKTEVSLKGRDFCVKLNFSYAASCFGNDKRGKCEEQGCISCDDGVVSPEDETCDFKVGETKYITLWFGA